MKYSGFKSLRLIEIGVSRQFPKFAPLLALFSIYSSFLLGFLEAFGPAATLVDAQLLATETTKLTLVLVGTGMVGRSIYYAIVAATPIFLPKPWESDDIAAQILAAAMAALAIYGFISQIYIWGWPLIFLFVGSAIIVGGALKLVTMLETSWQRKNGNEKYPGEFKSVAKDILNRKPFFTSTRSLLPILATAILLASYYGGLMRVAALMGSEPALVTVSGIDQRLVSLGSVNGGVIFIEEDAFQGSTREPEFRFIPNSSIEAITTR